MFFVDKSGDSENDDGATITSVLIENRDMNIISPRERVSEKSLCILSWRMTAHDMNNMTWWHIVPNEK